MKPKVYWRNFSAGHKVFLILLILTFVAGLLSDDALGITFLCIIAFVIYTLVMILKSSRGGELSHVDSLGVKWEKKRFFSFGSTREKIITWVSLGVIAFFLPAVAILWVVGGVIYYRVKFPRDQRGL
jgi:hypothetical protein